MRKKLLFVLFIALLFIGMKEIKAVSIPMGFQVDMRWFSNQHRLFYDNYRITGSNIEYYGYAGWSEIWREASNQGVTWAGYFVNDDPSLPASSIPRPPYTTDSSEQISYYIPAEYTIDLYNRYATGGVLYLYAHWCEAYSNTYTLNYNVNGGNYISPTTESYNVSKTLPTPSRSGYSFEGWYNSSGSKVTTTYQVRPSLSQDAYGCSYYPSVTITAHWKQNSHTLTIKPNGGKYNDKTTNTTVTLNEGATYDVQTPIRDGYIFLSWDASPSSAYNSDTKKVTMGTSDVTLSAIWTQPTYTITIDPVGGTYKGSTNAEMYLVGTGTVIEVPDPVKEHYTFTGWTEDPAVGAYNNSTKKLTVGTSNITMTANWTLNTRTLTVNPSGGTYKNSTNPTITTENEGEVIDIPDPTRNYYTFNGWTVSPSGAYNSSTKKVTIGTSNITLTANWTRNTHTLTINPSGGTYKNSTNPTTTTENEGDVIDIPDPTRKYYTFAGWTVNPASAYNSSNKKLTIGTGNISMSANWTRNKKTLTINPGGGKYNGSTSNTTVEVEEGSTYTLQIPTRDNYTFAGWEITPTTAYDATNRVLSIETSNVTVVAKWNVIKRTLTIDANGGIYENNQERVTKEVNQGEQYEIKTPTKGGFDFDGWTTEPNGVYNATTNKITVGPSDITMYAKWKNKICPSYSSGTYILQYDTAGGDEISVSVVNFPDGPNAQLPEPTKYGYFFDGWYFDSNYTRPVESKTTLVTSTPTAIIEDYCPSGRFETVTIYAKWRVDMEKVTNTNIYGTIYFNTNGGEPLSPINQNIIETNQLKELPKPKKNNYIFKGWFYDTALTNKVESPYVKDLNIPHNAVLNGLQQTTTYENITLNAKWIAKSDYCQPITNRNIKIEKINSANVINGAKSSHIFDNFIEVNYPFNDTEKQIIRNELFTYSPFEKQYHEGGAIHNITYTPKTFLDSDYTTEITYDQFIARTPEYSYDDEGCENGYEIIKMYQKSELTCVNGSSFTISFSGNGGNSINNITIYDPLDNWKDSLPTPTRNGYDFAGWYYDKDLTQPVDVKLIKEVSNNNDKKYDDVGCQDGWKDRTLYAKWIPNSKNPNSGKFIGITIASLIGIFAIIFVMNKIYKTKIYKI